jgi:hypothetical protein
VIIVIIVIMVRKQGYSGDSSRIADVAGQHHETRVAEILTAMAEGVGQVCELRGGGGLGRDQ